MPAKIVVIEGPDKVGKETVSKRLLADLTKNSEMRVVRLEATKESHPRGRKLIYSMLESGAARRYPNLFQFVQFLNRMYFQFFKLPKLLRDNHIVILDRWALSGYVYGKCEGINAWLNEAMYWCAKKADIVIVLWGTSYRRATADDSYEKDTDLQTRAKQAYYEACVNFPGHTLVHNTCSLDELMPVVMEKLTAYGILQPPCSVCKAAWDQDCDAGLHS
jgi:thymidylate kinase